MFSVLSFLSTTGFESVPIPSYVHSIRSPAFSRMGGVRADPERDGRFWEAMTGWVPATGVAPVTLRHPSLRGPLLEIYRATGDSEPELAVKYLAAAARHDPVIGFSGQPFARMIVESPTLTARLRELHETREEALAATLAAEHPVAEDGVVKHLFVEKPGAFEVSSAEAIMKAL